MIITRFLHENVNSCVSSFRGRGSSLQTRNKFEKIYYVSEPPVLNNEEAESEINLLTRLIFVEAKSMINKVESEDLPFNYSVNPYQGCEHGCSYCYARPTHEYWGMNAGIDFEQTIFYKYNAIEILRKELLNKKDALPIALSGNTDCYQPVEKKLCLTRKILKLFLEFNHPVSIITKNSLILRDLDILKKLAEKKLVFVYVSVNTIEEEVRRVLEPRTSSVKNRFKIMRELSKNNVPCGVLIAPVIPGLNNIHLPQIMKTAWENGAVDAEYSVIRLNDIVSEIFRNWLNIHVPDRADKIWNLIKQIHNGNVYDYRMGVRLKGEGPFAQMIKQLFLINKKRYFGRHHFEFNMNLFLKSKNNKQQLKLF